MITMDKLAKLAKDITIILIASLINILIFYGCAASKKQVAAGRFEFIFENEEYQIRSIYSEDDEQAYNKLIGENFEVIDYNQDRVIDHIISGNINLEQAQKIYDHGLKIVERENRLQIRLPENHCYVYQQDDYDHEISSFQPNDMHSFNEFKIIDKRSVISHQVTIIIDYHADGILDQVLKGTMTLEQAQSLYTDVLEAGLRDGELIRVNNKILVR